MFTGNDTHCQVKKKTHSAPLQQLRTFYEHVLAEYRFYIYVYISRMFGPIVSPNLKVYVNGAD
jgi:hypothetical protein